MSTATPLPVGYELPGNVVATTELVQALDGAEAIIFAVPSTHLRSVCHQAAPLSPPIPRCLPHQGH
ncbi:MAG: hypothetical protein ACLTYW_02440 [Collinsella sp.]